jgi:hypothetical protein
MPRLSPPDDPKSVEVRVADLKAIFFVKCHTGNPHYYDLKDFHTPAATAGRNLKFGFNNGETIADAPMATNQTGRVSF